MKKTFLCFPFEPSIASNSTNSIKQSNQNSKLTSKGSQTLPHPCHLDVIAINADKSWDALGVLIYFHTQPNNLDYDCVIFFLVLYDRVNISTYKEIINKLI